jgi:hypothetical protein
MDAFVTDAVLAALEYFRAVPALVLPTLTSSLYSDRDAALGI